MPATLAHATSGLDDKAVRDIDFSWQQTTGTQTTATTHEAAAPTGQAPQPPDMAGLPPPTRPEIRATT
jgi:hypothetical protein